MKGSKTPTICLQCMRANLPPLKANMMADMVEVARTRPDLTYPEIAKAFGVSPQTVHNNCKRAGLVRGRGYWSAARCRAIAEGIARAKAEEKSDR